VAPIARIDRAHSDCAPSASTEAALLTCPFFNPPIPRGQPDCPSLRAYFTRPSQMRLDAPLPDRAPSLRARCASKTGRSGCPLSSTLLFTNSHSRGERLGSSATARIDRAHSDRARSASTALAPTPPASSFTLQHSLSREGRLTTLHCARPTSTFSSCALREQDRVVRPPSPLTPIPPAHTLSPPSTDAQKLIRLPHTRAMAHSELTFDMHHNPRFRRRKSSEEFWDKLLEICKAVGASM
jgi:hypothetical protein